MSKVCFWQCIERKRDNTRRKAVEERIKEYSILSTDELELTIAGLEAAFGDAKHRTDIIGPFINIMSFTIIATITLLTAQVQGSKSPEGIVLLGFIGRAYAYGVVALITLGFIGNLIFDNREYELALRLQAARMILRQRLGEAAGIRKNGKAEGGERHTETRNNKSNLGALENICGGVNINLRIHNVLGVRSGLRRKE